MIAVILSVTVKQVELAAIKICNKEVEKLVVHPIIHNKGAISDLSISEITAAKMIFDLELGEKIAIVCASDAMSMFIARTLLGNRASNNLLQDIYVVGISTCLDQYINDTTLCSPEDKEQVIVIYPDAQRDEMDALIMDDLYEVALEINHKRAEADETVGIVKCQCSTYRIEPYLSI